MSDEIEQRLAAWLDGALSPVEATAFEAELAANPELAARAASWRANDAFIADALAPLASEPIAPELLAKLGLAGPVAANDNPPWWRRQALPLGGAVAASLALVLVMAQPGQQRDELAFALDTTASLKQTRLADGRVIEPTITVRAADGRWCREFRSSGTISLACRKNGRWAIESEVRGIGPVQNGDFELAGASDNAALDAAYRRIGASDPVGPAREAELIGQGWD